MVSIVPIVVMTYFASLNTYNALYDQLMWVNISEMDWSQERLNQLISELKNTVYAMESDSSFKNAVIKLGQGEEDYNHRTVIGKTLNRQLNKSILFHTLEMHFPNDQVIKVKNTGVSWGVDYLNFTEKIMRVSDRQTNLYLKPTTNGVYAVHHINKFENREHAAQLVLNLKIKHIDYILNKLTSYANERIYLLNDEDEIIQSIGGLEADEGLLEELITLSDYEQDTGHFNKDKNIVFYGTTEGRELKIIKIIPKSAIIGATKPTIIMGITIGVICIAGAILISFVLALVITQPIVQLTEKVKNISMETLEIEAGKAYKDEVSVLDTHIALFVERIRDLIREEYDMKIQAKSAQINALQAQINPHFLHNTLQLMGSIALSKNVKEVYNIAIALSNMMRYNMDFEKGVVTIGQELSHLDNYLSIQKQRFYDKFQLDLKIQEEVKQCYIPKMLIQPIVENSFQHGFERSSGDWQLSIFAYLSEEDQVHIRIRDNGIGMSEEKLKSLNEELEKDILKTINRGEHIGLLNVNSRMQLHFSTEAGIKIKSVEGGGIEVELILDAVREVECDGV